MIYSFFTNWVSMKAGFAMKAGRFFLLAMTVGAAFGCVHPQQIDLIEREQRRMRSETGSVQSDIESLRSTVADIRANLQQMQRDVSVLKERVDETRVQVGRQIGQTSREGDERVKNLETRLQKFEESFKAQEELLKTREDAIKQLREAMDAQQKSGASDATNEVRVAESEAIKRDYEAAWRLLEKKDYKPAIGRFKEFIKKYPKSTLAGNAQYWIGESHYALREFDLAIIEFDAVRRKYPQGEKVPAALLKQGFAFAELGEKLNARLILQEVTEKYPQSPEAVRAKQRLKSLES
jgi:tol-pal system protein YbgF